MKNTNNGNQFLMRIKSTIGRSSYKVSGNMQLDLDFQDIYDKLKQITEACVEVDKKQWDLFIHISNDSPLEFMKNSTFIEIVDGSDDLGYCGFIQVVEGNIGNAEICDRISTLISSMIDNFHNPDPEMKAFWGMRAICTGLRRNDTIVRTFTNQTIKALKESFKHNE